MILGPALEENVRRALLMSRGKASIFLTSPISLAMLLLTVAFIEVFARPKKVIKTSVELNATERAEGDAALL
jgi:TctA family transporter